MLSPANAYTEFHSVQAVESDNNANIRWKEN